MKQFWKIVFATLVALIIFSAICSVVSLFFLIGLSSLGSSSPSLPKSGGLNINMSCFELAETSSDSNADLLSYIQGNSVRTIGIWDAVQAINAAAIDPAVKFISIKADEMDTGMSGAEELRKALLHFRQESGKPIVAYTEFPTTGVYWLISVSDKIYMSANSGSGPGILGVGTNMVFLKDILDKLGIHVQLIRHGKYKSAGETYVRSEPSEENRHQYQEMINSIWGTVSSETALSRVITPESYSAMIDELKLCDAKDMLENGLVDALVTREEYYEKLMTLAGVSKKKDLKMADFPDYVDAKLGTPMPTSKKRLAIVYADGNIVEGSGSSNIAGERFAGVLAEVRADSTVKAVVLRVNSPGGTVLAADKIRTEVNLLRAEKPVIASYGDYAASGGYWISSSCDKIFSDRTTLTGSIGVFSIIPDFSKTASDLLHVNVTSINSNKHGDMLSGMRPLDKDELAYMQEGVERIYTDFVNNVAEGRGLDVDYVDEIAQGRVWTGEDALDIGLVDEIGTLEDAIHYAVIAAGSPDSSLDSWDIVSYPKQPSTFEKILEFFGMGYDEATVLDGTPFENVGKAFRGLQLKEYGEVYARLPYEIVIK